MENKKRFKNLIYKRPYLLAGFIGLFYQLNISIVYYIIPNESTSVKRIFTFMGGDFLSGGFFQGLILSSTIWAFLEIMKQRKLVRIENRGFDLGLLSKKDTHVLLPMDLPDIEEKISQLSSNKKKMLVPRILSSAISKFRATHSMGETIDIISIQADLQREYHEASQSNIRYLLWLIPSLGFMGTVVGLSQSLGIAHEGDMKMISTTLGLAFDTTLLALVLGAIITGQFHRLQEEMDTLHARLKDFIVTHFINKLELKKFKKAED